ncbi:glycine betaine transporter [Oceanobacillus iheyensis HTE831]|uniref:Glycine betaine transporter n=1 Tax=Oceanobacillus iheyensis (strain DSM 14371 / CIP 107618 / JCM 11309 / KCTC 3954 / HTE831) TaxID=221109 RepID=Q8ET62_OCEIH|nr:BCCT family transporter [Oceanobacillus iheyensis]BAC12356.1 glycine betaine transporter [Oceanobacillus iheyensis HTE831]
MKKVTNVFYFAVILVGIMVALGAIFPVKFEQISQSVQAWVSSTFGWYYLLLMSVLVAVALFIAVSPYGNIRLGKDSDRPDFSNISWVAMLFAAGIGIGLVFYGASEPLAHFMIDAPLSEPGTAQAFKEALSHSFFHWGIHGWSMYGLVALAIAYFQFRKDEPGLISVTLKPLFGDRMNGGFGKAIDALAIFATVVGVATSLGLGAIQINAGLSHLFDLPVNIGVQATIILIVTVLFIISAWSGLNKGIKTLSNINLILALILFIFVLAVGPTLLIFNMFSESIGLYFQNFIQMSFRSAPLASDNRAWLDIWTIFYWAWWISWAPFVGIFVARISRGRTIRQFIFGVIIVPVLVISAWFTVFGTTAGDMQQQGIVDLTQFPTELVLFNMFDYLPLSTIISLLAIFLLVIFFITSADSATFVLGMQSTGGSLSPPNSVKVALGLSISAVALILLYVGGLSSLQNTVIVAALPFSFVIILMVISLYKALKEDAYIKKRKTSLKKNEEA